MVGWMDKRITDGQTDDGWGIDYRVVHDRTADGDLVFVFFLPRSKPAGTSQLECRDRVHGYPVKHSLG